MKIGYYPGCSLHGTARDLGESVGATMGALSIELQEVSGWSCCGASSAHQAGHLLGVALPARNLALAEAQGIDRVMTPCAACFNRLAGARHAVAEDAAIAARVANALGRPFANGVAVASIVDVLHERREEIVARRTRPLAGLKVACYYGCLLVRPAAVTGAAECEQPGSMEEIAAATGADPVEWSKKLDCCGGSFSLARTGSVIRLGRAVIDDARAHGAGAIVVACPMCHSNLDFRQSAMRLPDPMPVLHLTQLVGLALGLAPDALGLGRHFVDTAPLLAQLPAPAAEGRA